MLSKGKLLATLVLAAILVSGESPADATKCEALLKDGLRDHLIIDTSNYDWVSYHRSICNKETQGTSVDAELIFDGLDIIGGFAQDYEKHMCGDVDYEAQSESIYSYVKNSINPRLAEEFNRCIKLTSDGITFSKRSLPDLHTMSITFRDTSNPFAPRFSITELDEINFKCRYSNGKLKTPLTITDKSESITCKRSDAGGNNTKAALIATFSDREAVVFELPQYPPKKKTAPPFPIRLLVSTVNVNVPHNTGTPIDKFDAGSIEVSGKDDTGVTRCKIFGDGTVQAYALNNGTGKEDNGDRNRTESRAETESDGVKITCTVLKSPAMTGFYEPKVKRQVLEFE